MALFPCDLHGGRYPGAQSSAYPALLNGTTSRRRKVRACLPCLRAAIDESPVPLMDLSVEPGPMFAPMRSGCRKHPDLEPKATFFLTAYPQGEDGEHNYYAQVCEGCGDDLAERWGLTA